MAATTTTTTTATAAVKGKRSSNNNNNKGPSNNNNKSSRRNERNILTFYEKIAVIRYYDETNISRNSLAKMFHCCATQIRRILEKKRELLQQLATLSEADASIIIEEMTRKRRKFEMSAISFLLHQWVERHRQLRLGGSIKNQQLKQTALQMAAVLNLPAFRPSYRWLNRFRCKYKYEQEEELGYQGEQPPLDEQLKVEHIIVEFKSALPNFMQKEIADWGSSSNQNKQLASNLVNLSSENSAASSEAEEAVEEEEERDIDADDDVVEISCEPALEPELELELEKKAEEQEDQASQLMNAGTCTLLNSVFPHLAIIHQFALMNSDVQALELISQLGVHMQQQANSGAYRTLSLATEAARGEAGAEGEAELPAGTIYADIDDIELIE